MDSSGFLTTAVVTAASAACIGFLTLAAERRLRKTFVDVEETAMDRAAQDMALQSYYEGGKRPHRRNADDLMLGSGRALAQEIRGCFEGINEVGRGIVYFGSARFEPGSELYEKGKALAKSVAELLKVPAWSGGGKGMMGAVTHGCREAGYPVGAVRISREASDCPGKAPPGDNPLHACTVFCQFMASRKIGLTDAGMRVTEDDKTAFIALPGGIGTLDETIEILVLQQLNKLGTNYEVPVILMNYKVKGSDKGYWDGIMKWMDSSEKVGALKKTELSGLKVCDTNEEAVKFLKNFYKV